MKMVVRLIWLGLVMLVAGANGWANVNTAAVGDEKSGIVSDSDQARRVATLFLQSLSTGKDDAVNKVLVVPTEGRLQEKLSLMMIRKMELMGGGDLKEEVLDPIRIQKNWGLLVTRETRPKADRDKVKLSNILLHKVENKWKVVPKVVFSDPSLNVSRDQSAQSLLRWFRAKQRMWSKLFVAPLVKDPTVPDAMRHLVAAPHFNIKQLRDPFASYLALVSQHSKKVLSARKSKLASRPKEVLEAFDLSSLRLVAIYGIHGERVAMLEDSEGKGHTVRVGNYMGKYNGKITAIDAHAVHLLEEMINPLGEVENKEMLLTLVGGEDTNKP